MFNNLLFILLQIPDTIIKYVTENPQVVPTATDSGELNLYNIIGMLLGAGGILYIVVQSILKQKEKKMENDLERKTKKTEAEVEVTKETVKHENALDIEKFNLEKQKDLKRLEENENFQKEIINEIFGKYVKQNDWITTIYEKKFEELTTALSEIKREVKDMRVLSDKMNMQIKNVDDKVIKNTNIIIAKTDALLKVFSNVTFGCVKDTLKQLPEENKKILKRESEEIKITQE